MKVHKFNPEESARLCIYRENGDFLKSIFDSFDSIAHARFVAATERLAFYFTLSQESGYYKEHKI
jgi:hypothetical protein